MLILLGYMGCGKSVVGQQVSDLIGLKFIDLDTYIEDQEKMSISQIFSEKGVIYFRKKENECLKELIRSEENVILSLGGGTPCYYNHMELINSTSNIKSFYLNAGINELTNRLWNERVLRPLISEVSNKEELTEFIGKHLFERRQYYQEAQYKINVDNKTIYQVAKEVISNLF